MISLVSRSASQIIKKQEAEIIHNVYIKQRCFIKMTLNTHTPRMKVTRKGSNKEIATFFIIRLLNHNNVIILM